MASCTPSLLEIAWRIFEFNTFFDDLLHWYQKSTPRVEVDVKDGRVIGTLQIHSDNTGTIFRSLHQSSPLPNSTSIKVIHTWGSDTLGHYRDYQKKKRKVCTKRDERNYYSKNDIRMLMRGQHRTQNSRILIHLIFCSLLLHPMVMCRRPPVRLGHNGVTIMSGTWFLGGYKICGLRGTAINRHIFLVKL